MRLRPCSLPPILSHPHLFLSSSFRRRHQPQLRSRSTPSLPTGHGYRPARRSSLTSTAAAPFPCIQRRCFARWSPYPPDQAHSNSRERTAVGEWRESKTRWTAAISAPSQIPTRHLPLFYLPPASHVNSSGPPRLCRNPQRVKVKDWRSAPPRLGSRLRRDGCLWVSQGPLVCTAAPTDVFPPHLQPPL
ncbi:hypothetical protein BRADI_4g00332v3 [Brachypodium distachyon]|nr:hypothetical protein BRADI_4g00332v3 [Brachypodium distachyon]